MRLGEYHTIHTTCFQPAKEQAAALPFPLFDERIHECEAKIKSRSIESIKVFLFAKGTRMIY
jgi:hypothetical protein